ncbi:PilZ domain-containing protein [Sporomusa sp. KB1]|nr:PilZ domain-containing protein [Sporomusa sp. KB1]
MIEEGVYVDYHEKREWGRIRVSQALILRSEKNPKQAYHAVAIDVSEENIGIETNARLSLGECIQLELESESKPIVVQAIVKRIFNNRYGCTFTDADFGRIFDYYVNMFGIMLEELKVQGKHLLMMI